MMTLVEVNDLLSEALQSDLEHGVKWMNEAASLRFARDYPKLNNAIAFLYEKELVALDKEDSVRTMPD